jgi:hypothetical protein
MENSYHNCYECLKDVFVCGGVHITLTRMILCPECGNKRCPQATDHRLACTGSNEAGQPGRRYGQTTDSSNRSDTQADISPNET